MIEAWDTFRGGEFQAWDENGHTLSGVANKIFGFLILLVVISKWNKSKNNTNREKFHEAKKNRYFPKV